MDKNCVYLRTDLLNGIPEGVLTPAALGVYALLQLQANPRSGIWLGTAEKLEARFPQFDAAVVEWNFAKLEKARLVHIYRGPGPRPATISYRILIDNFVVTEGVFCGQSLDAFKSAESQSLVYAETQEAL